MSIRSVATRIACASALLVSPWLTSVSQSQTITLQTALQRALATSPRLTAAERDVGIASGQRLQAGALINPEVSYEQDNSFGSRNYRGTRSAETTLQISQLFELFGKRDARIAAGQAGVETATSHWPDSALVNDRFDPKAVPLGFEQPLRIVEGRSDESGVHGRNERRHLLPSLHGRRLPGEKR